MISYDLLIRSDRGKIMTAVQISEDIHLRMAKKRIEILEKYNLRFDMKDLADAAIEEGFDKIEKRLGIVKVT